MSPLFPNKTMGTSFPCVPRKSCTFLDIFLFSRQSESDLFSLESDIVILWTFGMIELQECLECSIIVTAVI